MAHNEPFDVAIQQAIRAAVIEAGINLNDCAAAIPMAPNSFSRRMNGHLAFQFHELVAIARVTRRPVSDLVLAAERIVSMRGDAA